MDLKSIAKALAASEAKTRSEGYIRMRSYLASQQDQDQLPYIWKSLFYCKFHLDLWMADKMHTETIQELESLFAVTKFDKFLWFQSFLETMRVQWEGLDPVRIDKFMLLVRYMLRTILLSAVQDTKTWAKLLSDFIEKCVYKAQSLLFHIADIYLEEIPECEFKTKVKLVLPFVKFMKTVKINHLIEMVYNKILLKLTEDKDEQLAKWLFKQATSEKMMQSRARDKFYDAYAVLTGETVPKREEPNGAERKKKKKKKKSTGNDQAASQVAPKEIVPDALQKVMNEFYNPVKEIQETKETLEILHIGKDAVELKHEEMVEKKKKKKKKSSEDVYNELCTEFSARTGKSLDGKGDVKKAKKNSQRKVNFNLKMNLVKEFDKKNVVSSVAADELKAPGKSILKRKNQNSNSPKPLKKQKTK